MGTENWTAKFLKKMNAGAEIETRNFFGAEIAGVQKNSTREKNCMGLNKMGGTEMRTMTDLPIFLCGLLVLIACSECHFTMT